MELLNHPFRRRIECKQMPNKSHCSCSGFMQCLPTKNSFCQSALKSALVNKCPAMNALLVSVHCPPRGYLFRALFVSVFFCPIRRTSPAGLFAHFGKSIFASLSVFHFTAIALHYSMSGRVGIERYLFASGHVPHGDVAMVCPHCKLVASFAPRHRCDRVRVGAQIAKSRHLKVQINDLVVI